MAYEGNYAAGDPTDVPVKLSVADLIPEEEGAEPIAVGTAAAPVVVRRCRLASG